MQRKLQRGKLFSTEFHILVVRVTARFFLTASSILVRIIPGAIFLTSQVAFNTLSLLHLVKSRMISL